MTIIALMSSLILSSLPDWLNELNPEGRIRLRWLERIEDKSDWSGPRVAAEVGLFPSIDEHFHWGIQIVAANPSIDSSPNSVALDGGMKAKPLSLHQVYIRYSSHHAFPADLLVYLGKFKSPLLFSPLLWDEEMHPEGALEIFSLRFFSDVLSLSLYAGQFSADQVIQSVVNGTPQRRSWLFQQGIELGLHPNPWFSTRFGLNHFHFHDPSEQLAESSGHIGNSFIGTLGNSPSFQNDYAPFEFLLALEGQPLGIHAELLGALAINWRTSEDDRGFFVHGSLGNAWKARQLLIALSYYYNEADTTIALFSDDQYAFTNRKGPRVQADYFIRDNFRLGGSFVFAEVISNSQVQEDRYEILVDFETRF